MFNDGHRRSPLPRFLFGERKASGWGGTGMSLVRNNDHMTIR